MKGKLWGYVREFDLQGILLASMIITILVGMLIFDPSFFGVDHRKDLAGLVVNYLH